MNGAVVVTRDERRDGPLSTRLRELGHEVIAWPAVSVAPPEDPGPLDAALAQAGALDWIVFASRHAVEAVTSRLRAPPPDVKIAAVGASTAAALRERGWKAEVVPEHANAQALVDVLAPQLVQGARVLFPASSRALPTLGAGLRELGAKVRQVEAYRTQAGTLDVQKCQAVIEQATLGAVTFTSPSCVDELARALGGELFEQLLKFAPAVVLGGTTARALAAHGFVCALAEPATLAGLAETTHRQLTSRP